MGLYRAARAAIFAPYLAVFYPLLAVRRAALTLWTRRAWRTWITREILLGGFIAPGDVEELEAEGIRAVVNVSRELRDPVRALRAAGIEVLRVPCWDMGTPDLADARRAVAFIAERVARGEKVYVHCASGVGRSVALTLCYLATHGGLSLEVADAEVRRLRPRVSMRARQTRFVEAFVAMHHAAR